MMNLMSEQQDSGASAREFRALVEVYSSPLCPYCARAVRLLKHKGADPKTIDVAFHPKRRAEMEERTRGRHTVPQIFINGAHIGGSDDLAALDRTGELDGLLAAAS